MAKSGSCEKHKNTTCNGESAIFSRDAESSGQTAFAAQQTGYEYFSNWYHPVIRELVTMRDFNGDSKSLARMIRPPITVKQAQESVKLLLKLGLIEKQAANRYRHSSGIEQTFD